MFIDLHMHERTYSTDSKLSLETIVAIAKKKGLDAVCITDHDSMGLKKYAQEYAKKTGFPIFVGVEYYSLQGDIVAFGIDTFPKERINAQAFIDMVNAQGGFCFSAHPFRNNNRGLEENLKTVRGLHGVEVLNGSTSADANQKAADYAQQLGLVPIGVSDCHTADKVGVYATYIPQQVHTPEEFVLALKSGEARPAYYLEGRYQVWNRKRQAAVV